MMAMISVIFLTALAIAVAVSAIIWSNNAIKDGEARSSGKGAWSGRPNVCLKIEGDYDGIYDTAPWRTNTAISVMRSA